MVNELQAGLLASIVNEIFAVDQRLRIQLLKLLPSGMEISHFACLNFLSTIKGERTPAQIAESLNVTRGAMSNTLSRLERSGFINIRTDWDDGRVKWVSISQAGRVQRDMAFQAAAPFLDEVFQKISEKELRELHESLRTIRSTLTRLSS